MTAPAAIVVWTVLATGAPVCSAPMAPPTAAAIAGWARHNPALDAAGRPIRTAPAVMPTTDPRFAALAARCAPGQLRP